MDLALPTLLAQSVRTVFHWDRIQQPSDWLLPLLLLGFVAALAVAIYRRDAARLPRWKAMLLVCLRLATVVLLWLWLLDPRWQTERETVRNSQVLFLVDTSLSMTLPDAPSATSPGEPPQRRIDRVVAALADRQLFEALARKHDVAVYRFDQGDPVPLAVGEKGRPTLKMVEPNTGGQKAGKATAQSDPMAGTLPPLSVPSQEEPLDTLAPQWDRLLAATGRETRLGQAIDQLLIEHRNGPVAGIVLLTDGAANAGMPVERAVEVAHQAGVPLFPVGLGSDRQAANVRLAELDAPPVVAPGDPYQAVALLQSYGLEGRSVTVEILIRQSGQQAQTAELGTVLQSRQVELLADGQLLPVRFELAPEKPGRYVLAARVRPAAEDSDASDNMLEQPIDVIDRPLRVLLLAGGPSREYQFVRTMLFRNRSTTLDVLLQTAQEGISQEADRILSEFPRSPGELFEYDCLVAIDPNWLALAGDRNRSIDRINLMEQWVDQQGGGVVLIPGQVYAGEQVTGWIDEPALDKLRALYPVELPRTTSAMQTRVLLFRQAQPLGFTAEGLRAEHLRIDQTAGASQRRWAEFPGVYSCLATYSPKAGATVLARLVDPGSPLLQLQPVYAAEQFYGFGRVFYLGSGEMWRLRQLGEEYFERFYTKVIRHVCQGRLERQSPRGFLLLDSERFAVGEVVTIRARLADRQLKPLKLAEVPLRVHLPGGDVRTVSLTQQAAPGTYAGQVTLSQEGTYRLELPLPETPEQQLVKRIRAGVPDLERQSPLRNDALLARIAEQSGGHYFTDISAAFDPQNPDGLLQLLRDRTQKVTLSGPAEQPSLERLLLAYFGSAGEQPAWLAWLMRHPLAWRVVQQPLAWWLMVLVCGCLCVEWILRRVWRLA